MEHFHASIRNPKLSLLTRKILHKKIQEKAKKSSICPHCGETNGVIKKCGALKISYEKYRKLNADEVASYLSKSVDYFCLDIFFCMNLFNILNFQVYLMKLSLTIKK